jgi:hypothetical protein
MRSLRLLPITGFLLLTGLLVGCSKESPRMKNQPTNLNSGETKMTLPGKKKAFDAGQ